MPIDFFGAALRNSQPEKGSRPMLNQNFMSSGGRFSSYTNFFSGFSFKRYWQWFRTRPELYSIISIPVNDIIGGEVDYYDLDGNPLGRNRLIKAKKFWSDNQMKQVMKGIEFDCHLTGNGFGWIGKLDKGRIEKELDKFANLKYKELGMDKELFKFKVMQELENCAG